MVEVLKISSIPRPHIEHKIRSDSANQNREKENNESMPRKNSASGSLHTRRLASGLKIENPKRLQSADKLESAPAGNNTQQNFRAFGGYLDSKEGIRKKQDEEDEFMRDWEQIGTLGKGCHGICYLMKNKKDLMYYACKIIKTHDPEIIKNERNAFNILKDLSHEGIVRVKDLQINEVKGSIRLVMKYVPGTTLSKYIQKQGPAGIAEADAAKILKNIAHSINYLHKKGICHRDIKPENILVDKDTFNTVLIDFGIAKYFKKKSVKEYTKVSEVTQEMWTPTGSHFYKAPEMLEGDAVTEKVDIWALGVTLFEIITGKRPFECSRTEDMIDRMHSQEITFNDKFWRGSHPTLKLLIKRLLQPDPKKRMSSLEVCSDSWILYWDVRSIKELFLTKEQTKAEGRQNQQKSNEKIRIYKYPKYFSIIVGGACQKINLLGKHPQIAVLNRKNLEFRFSLL